MRPIFFPENLKLRPFVSCVMLTLAYPECYCQKHVCIFTYVVMCCRLMDLIGCFGIIILAMCFPEFVRPVHSITILYAVSYTLNVLC